MILKYSTWNLINRVFKIVETKQRPLRRREFKDQENVDEGKSDSSSALPNTTNVTMTLLREKCGERLFRKAEM